MIFFNEPSHFAIESGPFYFYYIVTNKKNILFLILAIISAILLQNLTLLIPIIISLYITNKKYFILLLVMSVLLLPILSSEFITYLTDRSVGIGNSSENNNLSGLVYIQGWEYVISIFKNFYGIGIGFQQMGQIKINSNAQDFLHFIGYPLNENDGSFLFSKLIVEFGIIGLIISLYYLFKIPTVYKSLKISINKQSSIHIFAYSCYLFLGVLLFVRNYSYFNPAILLFFVSLFIIINKKQIEK